MFEKVVNNWDFMVVLEDDVPVPDNFSAKIRRIVSEMFGPNTSTQSVGNGGDSVFSKADQGKVIEIKDGKVKFAANSDRTVDGGRRWWEVQWSNVSHADGSAKIVSVESKLRGKVRLDDWTVFENPGDWAGVSPGCLGSYYDKDVPVNQWRVERSYRFLKNFGAPCGSKPWLYTAGPGDCDFDVKHCILENSLKPPCIAPGGKGTIHFVQVCVHMLVHSVSMSLSVYCPARQLARSHTHQSGGRTAHARGVL